MNRRNEIAAIRRMIAQGYSDAEIQSELREPEAETLEAEQFERDAYGYDDDDGLSSGQREYNDRLDMGRNDAGEWLGFM